MSGISWADLTYSIARHLESMPPDTYFSLYVDENGTTGFDPEFDSYPRYVQFCAYEVDMVRCEVVSNVYLPDDMKHSVDDLIALRADGWQLPGDEHINGSPNIFLDVPTVATDSVAQLVMRVFNRTWNVEAPAGVITDQQYLEGRNPFRILDAPAGYLPSIPNH